MGRGMGGRSSPPARRRRRASPRPRPRRRASCRRRRRCRRPKGRRKRWKLFELDGYFRLRTDWFKNFNLGFLDDPALGGAPFPRALGCTRDARSAPVRQLAVEREHAAPPRADDQPRRGHVDPHPGRRPRQPRPRLDADRPATSRRLHRHEPAAARCVQRHAGAAGRRASTATATRSPIKRAWAEVAVPLGILKFGRLPNHWGMGIFAQRRRRRSDQRHLRLRRRLRRHRRSRQLLGAASPARNLRAMIASDWDIDAPGLEPDRRRTRATKVTRSISTTATTSNGWVGVISRMDSPQEFRDTVDRGDARVQLRRLLRVQDAGAGTTTSPTSRSAATLDAADRATCRATSRRTRRTCGPSSASAAFTLEGEFVAQFGTVERLDELRHHRRRTTSASTAASAALTWKGLEGKLRLGLEGGFASGDQWDNTPAGRTNIAYANLLGDPTVCNAHDMHAHAVHLQPRLQGRHDPVAPPDRRGDERRLRQAVPLVRPHQVDHVQGREHHVVRAQAGRDAGQQRRCTAPSSTATSATPAAACSPASRTACCSRSAR